MQINKKDTTKRVIIIIGLVLALLVAGVAAAALLKLGPFASTALPRESVDLNKPTDDQVKNGESIKQDTVENKGGSTGSDPLPSPTPGTTPGDKSTVDMQITAYNQDSDTVYIRSLIQLITSSGSCQLRMSGPNGKTYSATSGVQAVSSSSTCGGFNIPVSSLSPGNWTINLSFSNDSYSASVTRDIVVK